MIENEDIKNFIEFGYIPEYCRLCSRLYIFPAIDEDTSHYCILLKEFVDTSIVERHKCTMEDWQRYIMEMI